MMTRTGFTSRRAIYSAIAVLAIVALTGCGTGSGGTAADVPSSQSQAPASPTNDAYAAIPSDQIHHASAETEFLWRPDEYQAVALVHIDSIDGGRTFNPISKQYNFPETVGKFTVVQAYRGELKPGDQANYARRGGIVTVDDYWRSLKPLQQEKILSLNNGKRPDTKPYIEMKSSSDDIDVEVGKDYLVFLVPRSSANGDYSEFVIGGETIGMREARGAGSDVTVLNNVSGEWEPIDKVLSSNGVS